MFFPTLRYVFKAANQLWLWFLAVLLLFILLDPVLDRPGKSDPVLRALLQGLLFALLALPPLCKAIDCAARIRAGKGGEPVPSALVRELRLSELAQYLAGVGIFALAGCFLPGWFYAPVFFALLPAIHDSFLETRTFAAMFSPGALLAACARIGAARYCHILLIYLLIGAALSLCSYLLAPPLANGIFALIVGIALGASEALVLLLLAGFVLAMLLNYLGALVWLFATLYPAMLCHGWRRPPIPDDDDDPQDVAPPDDGGRHHSPQNLPLAQTALTMNASSFQKPTT